jgi:hypothetical protein
MADRSKWYQSPPADPIFQGLVLYQCVYLNAVDISHERVRICDLVSEFNCGRVNHGVVHRVRHVALRIQPGTFAC